MAEPTALADELTRENVRAFLVDLTNLSRQHGIIIAGCGCCGSPWLSRGLAVNSAYYAEHGNKIWDSLDYVAEDAIPKEDNIVSGGTGE